MTLKGKTALVTGSTSGIGKAIAQALAGEGAKVILNGFGTADEIEALKRDLTKTSGAPADYLAADLSKPAEIAAMMATLEKAHGGADILVNNAGIQYVAPLVDYPTEKWDQIIAINLTALFHTTRLALPGMRAKGWGRIINQASVHGLIASPDKSAYTAAKHGVVGLTKVTALETAGQGITCNAICPGWVLTPLVAEQIKARATADGSDFEAAGQALLAEKTPSMQFVTPEQIGGLVVFLSSATADQITGTSQVIDGGWMAR